MINNLRSILDRTNPRAVAAIAIICGVVIGEIAIVYDRPLLWLLLFVPGAAVFAWAIERVGR